MSQDIYIDLEFPINDKGKPIRTKICEVTLIDGEGEVILSTPVAYAKAEYITQRTLDFFDKPKSYYLNGISERKAVEIIMDAIASNRLISWGPSDVQVLNVLICKYKTEETFVHLDLAHLVSKILDIQISVSLKSINKILGNEELESNHDSLQDTVMLYNVHKKLQDKTYKELLVRSKKALATQWLSDRLKSWNLSEEEIQIIAM